MDLKAIGFPSIYVQGPGALASIPEWVKNLTRKPGIAAIVDPFVLPLFDQVKADMKKAGGSEMVLHAFSGECTHSEINRLVAKIGVDECGVVIGAGGGKALDTAKAVASALDVPLVIVPTVASSDAPTSRIAAIYDENHKIVAVPRMRRNPDAVIVDTSIILSAPRRFFVAGIGDAITKKFEVADAGSAGIPNFFDGSQTMLASFLANSCYDILRKDTEAALSAIDRGTPNAAFERVIEATVLYSGLAFEGGGLSIAHGMLRGFTAFPQTAKSLHGELVAYGLLVQLALADQPQSFLLDLKQFLSGIGLPTCLADIGLGDLPEVDVARIAELTFEAPYVAARRSRISPEGLVAAIARIEALGA
ncbi:MAG: hypothetical protein VR78_00815 [Hoeflea sp. BRH_c9]|nr:MAG: hypothetical protein VR78_00815 [Hoeflea sp. BRH_c9]